MIAALVLAAIVDTESVARNFVTALGADSVPAFCSITGVKTIDGTPWWSVREVIDRYRCIEIGSYRATPIDDTHLRVELDGRGVMENARRETRPLPPEWILTFDSGALAGATTAEQVEARAFIDAQTDDERARIWAASDGTLAYDIAECALNELRLALSGGSEAVLAAAPRLLDALTTLAASCARAQDRSGEAAAFRVSSICARLAGDARGSLAWAQASLDAAVAAGDCDAIAGGQYVLGEALRYNGQADAGIAMLAAPERAVDTLDDPRVALRSVHNASAVLFTREERYTDAIRMATQIAAKAAEYGWRGGEGGAYLTLANIYSSLGDEDLGSLYYRKAHGALTEGGNRTWAAIALSNAASDDLARGRTAAALATLERAERLAADADVTYHVAGVFGLFAEALTEGGRLDEAECLLLRESETLSDVALAPDNQSAFPFWSAWSHLRLRQGRALEALAYADHLCASSSTYSGCYVATARALRALGRLDEARQTLEIGVAEIENARAALNTDPLHRATYFAQHVGSYYELADLLVVQHQPDRALAIAELVKARTITDSLSAGRADVSVARSAEERATYEDLEKNLRAANQAYVAAHMRGGDSGTAAQAAEQARAALQRYDGELAMRHGRKLPEASTRAPDIGGLIDSRNEAAISYAVGPDATLAFVAYGANARLDAVRIPIARDALAARVDAFVTAISQRRLDYAAEARALYDLLLAPVARQIAGRETICIVPDNVLWKLPFHALLGRDGEPVIAHHAVFYAPSLTLLARTKPSASWRESLLALGDPAFDANAVRNRAATRDADLAPLPDTHREVQEIARLYARHTVYTGANADEKRFKDEAPRHDVLHLATHGLLQDRWPMYSAVLLAPSRDEDGVVEAREILELDLDADLAVLSACDTGRGRISAGEGVIGMSWALMIAGCRSTIVSDWKAASDSTAELMIAFHRARVTAGLSNAAALREAQLALRKRRVWRHPFYWAPFIVVGGNL